MISRGEWIIRSIVGLICLVVSVYFLYCLLLRPTNVVHNTDPAKQAEMWKSTLAWARLAPLPNGAAGVTIQRVEDPFTRSFSAHFTADQPTIAQWIAESPGLLTAKIETMQGGRHKYLISPGGGASYAEVISDPSTGEIAIYVCGG